MNVVDTPVVSILYNSYTTTDTYYLDTAQTIRVATKVHIFIYYW